ncbi:MAG TPA: sigma-70 family RNA polymerase sigma factor [Solirubrobacterales bacterium]|nr:sigma-70 family RNA polymerase sigma factor [Solirubrobacterales bacterium]
MDASTSAAGRITDQQLREAREGLIRLLHKKRFPREWIERHVPDAMGQAEVDFSARLAAGKEDDTVGLLVVIAYRRAVKMLRAQLAKPTASIETVFHLADDSPSPEEEAIRHELQERVTKAMSHLPEPERVLLTLCYRDSMSIREAGRQVGWGKSVANRRHRAALEKLKASLDPSL